MQVSELRMVPLDKLTHIMCAWKGCDQACEIRNMPKGWVWLLTYWSRKPELLFMKIPARDMSRDTVLCPQHAFMLERQLRETGR